MIMKLPFLTLRRHIEVACYTKYKNVAELAPCTTMGRGPMADVENVKQDDSSFRTCYGFVRAFKKSLTVHSWCEIAVQSTEADVHYAFPRPEINSVEFHQSDLAWRPSDVFVSKLISPWALVSDTDVDFVVAHHILNTSGMIVPSGIVNFKNVNKLQIFNYIPKNVEYKIGFNTPLVSIFPLSDKPLHVRSIFDQDAFDKIDRQNDMKPFFKASGLKAQRLREMDQTK